MKKIREYIFNHLWAYILIMSCILGATACNVIYPLLTRDIVNDVFKDGYYDKLWFLLVGLVACGIGKAVFGYLKEYTADKTGSQIGMEMREELFNHIQGLSMDYFAKTNTGELMARLKDDINNIWMVIGFIGSFMVEVIIHVTCILYCMIRIDLKLTLVPVLIMVFTGAVAIRLEKKLDKVYEEISEENATLTTIAGENLSGVRTVKAFAREEFEIKKFLSHNHKYYSLNMQEAKILATYDPVFTFVAVLMPSICTVLGGISVIRGNMDIGSLVAYVEYSRNCTWPMEVLGWLVNATSSAIASRKKIRKIFDETATINENDNPVLLDEIKGYVKFDNVSFSIGGENILEQVSFDIPQNKTLGIMGATGSGKSTVISLLQRFYDVTEGSITVDGMDIRQMSLAQLRGNISVVTQDVFLFSDTVAENIKMGKSEAMDTKAIVKAARLAQAADFVEKMEDKYNTVIGERGVGLSGGQKQRLSIARAFAKETPILVLDDSTSALDSMTEKTIQKNLMRMEATKIIVAHRISSVRNADEIIYLQDGKVAERGTHEELMEMKGLYYDTFVAQYGIIPIELMEKAGEAVGC